MASIAAWLGELNPAILYRILDFANTSETWRRLGGHCEAALQRQAGLTQRSFLEQSPDQRDTVGNSSRRREFRQWP